MHLTIIHVWLSIRTFSTGQDRPGYGKIVLEYVMYIFFFYFLKILLHFRVILIKIGCFVVVTLIVLIIAVIVVAAISKSWHIYNTHKPYTSASLSPPVQYI